MIKRLQKIGGFIVLIIGLNSCAFHSGLMTGNASLNNADFNIVDFAIGSSETIKVLGFGGLKSEALVLEAKRNLYENYPLKKGQALANVTVDFKNEFYLLWSKLKVVVSAEVVDFNKTNKDYIPISTLLGIENNDKQEFFNIGDEVFFFKTNNFEKGKITDISKKRLTIQFFDSENRLRIVKQINTGVYLCEQKKLPEKFNFNIGDKVLISVPISANEEEYEEREVKIIGLGLKSALVEYVDRDNVRKKLEKNYSLLIKN